MSGIKGFWIAARECQLSYCGQIELEMFCLLFLQRNGLKSKYCQVLVCICQTLVCLIIISSFLHSGAIDASSSLYSILPQPASTLVLSLHCSSLLLWELQMLLSSSRQISPWESPLCKAVCLGMCMTEFIHLHPWHELREPGAVGMPLESLWMVCVCVCVTHWQLHIYVNLQNISGVTPCWLSDHVLISACSVL